MRAPVSLRRVDPRAGESRLGLIATSMMGVRSY
jgi:hypothetical protein